MNLLNEMIYIGRVSGTKGVGGDLRVSSFDDLSPLKGKVVILKRGNRKDLHRVERQSDDFSSKGQLLKLEGVDNIGEAKVLATSSIYIAKKDILKYFKSITQAEMVDMEVYDRKRGKLGFIEALVKNDAYTSYLIRGKYRILFPAIEEFVKEVDRERRIVDVDLGDMERFRYED